MAKVSDKKSTASRKPSFTPKNPDEYSETLRNETPTKNPLNSYLPKPLQIFFASQMNEEKVVLMLRRHPITQWKKMLIAIAMFFAPVLFFSSPMLEYLPPRYKLACMVGWYLLLTSFVLEAFLIWFFDVYIITDERIIDVDFNNLISKNISSAKIDNIEDITVETGGILGSMVDYGTIYIQTAGEKPELEFQDVPHPARVTKILNELILEEEQEKIENRVR